MEKIYSKISLLTCSILMSLSSSTWALPYKQTEPFPDWAIKNLTFTDMFVITAILFFIAGVIAFIIAVPIYLIAKIIKKNKKQPASK